MKEKIKLSKDNQIGIKQTSTPDYINNDNPENMKKIIKEIEEKKKEEEALNNGK